MLGIEKSSLMIPKVHNYSILITTYVLSIGRMYGEMVRIKFWRDKSTEGHIS